MHTHTGVANRVIVFFFYRLYAISWEGSRYIPVCIKLHSIQNMYVPIFVRAALDSSQNDALASYSMLFRLQGTSLHYFIRTCRHIASYHEIHVFILACVSSCMSAHARVHSHICMYVYMINMHVCTRLDIHIFSSFALWESLLFNNF
jgi:hypothetical protein